VSNAGRPRSSLREPSVRTVAETSGTTTTRINTRGKLMVSEVGGVEAPCFAAEATIPCRR
jgi:hypothetical protein